MYCFSKQTCVSSIENHFDSIIADTRYGSHYAEEMAGNHRHAVYLTDYKHSKLYNVMENILLYIKI